MKKTVRIPNLCRCLVQWQKGVVCSSNGKPFFIISEFQWSSTSRYIYHLTQYHKQLLQLPISEVWNCYNVLRKITSFSKALSLNLVPDDHIKKTEWQLWLHICSRYHKERIWPAKNCVLEGIYPEPRILWDGDHQDVEQGHWTWYEDVQRTNTKASTHAAAAHQPCFPIDLSQSATCLWDSWELRAHLILCKPEIDCTTRWPYGQNCTVISGQTANNSHQKIKMEKY